MDKLKTEDKIGRRWVIFGLADLINPISSLSKFRSDFTCYLFLVVLSMWVGDPYKAYIGVWSYVGDEVGGLELGGSTGVL
uniref:Uncharacterized protein n=1 Tax=Brassica oleracea TaxID=3712 RepID=A0A3P6FEF9_BRAOL|nr:unnamed protein product [Brassica oleracea]